MSIARLKKLSLIGKLETKTAILEHLQSQGCMHLVPLAPPPAEPEKAATREADDAYKALRFLADVAVPRRQVHRDANFDVQAFVAETLELKHKIRETGDRRDFLAARIDAVRPWGDLIFPPNEELAGNHLWFYQLPVKHRADLEKVDLPWKIITTNTQFIYLVVVSPDEPAPDLLPVARTHVGALPLSELAGQLEEVEIALEALDSDRIALTRYLTLLRLNMSEAASQAELEFAQEQTRDDEALFAIQGWVAVDCIDDVAGYAETNGCAVLLEDPAWDDTPPTLLQQPDEEAAGVDLAMFYQVPGYQSWDPTILIVVSFAMFFAMIIADAGYGAIILLGLLVGWKRLGRSVKQRAWRRLGLILASATIAYGIVIGSYFGAEPTAGSALAALNILSLNDFDTMMRLSIIVGVVHIVIALAMNAWARRDRRSVWANLGWICAIAAGVLLWLSGQTGGVAALGLALLIGGLAAIVIFTSERPIIKPTDWLWRGLDGIKALGGAMGAFGDILSYMRLFALGLASASLALTFNDLAFSTMDALPGIGVLFGILILIVGHAMNFGLALMSGVVHGLRLNYIEFFKWGLAEEGVAFRPFARKEVQE